MEPLKIHENLDDLDGVFHADTGEKWVRRCSFKMSFRKKKNAETIEYIYFKIRSYFNDFKAFFI